MKHFPLLALIAACASAASAHAVTFNVSNLNDSGAGSLRAAVVAANGTAGAPHVINFGSNLQGTLALASEITITTDMTINGTGAHRLKIDGANAHRLFRINLPNSTQSVTLNAMELTRGAALVTEAGYGGAIYKSRGSLRILASNLTASTAATRGGAIYSDSGPVTIEWVTMSGNQVANGFQPSGGAAYIRAGLFTANHSVIANNSAEYGGGLSLVSPGINAVITNTLIEGNTAIGKGGGIYSVTLESFRMSNSALINNSVANVEGGGFFYDGSTTPGIAPGLIENSTFHDNKALGAVATSSALTVSRGGLTIRNSTFANNAVSPGAPFQRADSGALWVTGTDAQVKLISTLFDRNTRGNTGEFSDLARVAATQLPSTLDAANSLFRSDYNSSVITSQSAPNQFATDALLLPLDRSVGLAPVLPISRLSPAIDRGVNPGNLATDQRGTGFVRAWSDPNHRNDALARPDIGAYEFRGDAIFVGDFEQR